MEIKFVLESHQVDDPVILAGIKSLNASINATKNSNITEYKMSTQLAFWFDKCEPKDINNKWMCSNEKSHTCPFSGKVCTPFYIDKIIKTMAASLPMTIDCLKNITRDSVIHSVDDDDVKFINEIFCIRPVPSYIDILRETVESFKNCKFRGYASDPFVCRGDHEKCPLHPHYVFTNKEVKRCTESIISNLTHKELTTEENFTSMCQTVEEKDLYKVMFKIFYRESIDSVFSGCDIKFCSGHLMCHNRHLGHVTRCPFSANGVENDSIKYIISQIENLYIKNGQVTSAQIKDALLLLRSYPLTLNRLIDIFIVAPKTQQQDQFNAINSGLIEFMNLLNTGLRIGQEINNNLPAINGLVNDVVKTATDAISSQIAANYPTSENCRSLDEKDSELVLNAVQDFYRKNKTDEPQ